MTTTRYSSGIYADKQKPDDDLSEREMTVIRKLADGMQIKEIAWEERMSHRGVRWIIESLYRKLGVVNRVGLVRLAIRKGWVKA